MTGHDNTIVDTTLNGRWPLRLPRARAERAEWHTEAGWERARLDAIHERITPGQLIVEVGSECGDMAALYASWGADVALIEANWKSWPMQRAIWEANHLLAPVVTFDGFAGEGARPGQDTDGRLVLGGWPDAAGNGEDSPYDFRTLHSGYDFIPVLPLDVIRAEVGRPFDHIAVDVEGAEVDVMLGASRVLAEDRPVCHLSVHPDFIPQYQHTAQDLHALMVAAGYRGTCLARLHEEHWLYEPS